METLIYPFKPQIDGLEACVLLSAGSLGGSLQPFKHGEQSSPQTGCKDLQANSVYIPPTPRTWILNNIFCCWLRRTDSCGAAQKMLFIKEMYPCTSDKECSKGTYCHCPQHGAPHCLKCRRRKKPCNRDTMCCPGNYCSHNICVPVSDRLVSPRVPKLKDHKKLASKEHGWKKNQIKPAVVKGHEGDPCLRSSDCMEGYCCARHFWTKMCKPVLRQGEVCTRQRRKGSHGLELFQRCDCAKGLACKVWTDATSGTKSRLHVCQRV
ncbi:dickkopf-related protein 2 isoform X2 [Brienomyrus brachyistius]|uniref:dickkopf-related protein 2 isoform X2 n=1 Tax=Brienomyrus brachyistius TaxID=42636 RepID=UPI0020B27ED9|nr:dickkopf-related protein 2 isoform X2 [Brienomyrus brachyistius]